MLAECDTDTAIKRDLIGEVPAMVSTKLGSLMEGNSGHAHGGQFMLPFGGGLIAPNQGLLPKYDAGLYTDGNTNMVVSRGIGNSIIPIRFNNRPEIVVATLIGM